MRIGVGYRRELAAWIDSGPPGVSCLEITAEHFYESGEAGRDQLGRLRARFQLYVHGLGLSLGTPGPLEPERLDQFARITAAADPAWISEHVAFTRTSEGDLGHLNPVPPTKESLAILVDHAREVSARCGKPLLLENITSHFRWEGKLTETTFLNELCARAGCGLLLDVTNLYINSRNHRFDALAWLREIDPRHIGQLHLVGYSRDGERCFDDHAQPVQEELLELARAVIAYAPVRAIILERDESFPGPEAMAVEISKLMALSVLSEKSAQPYSTS